MATNKELADENARLRREVDDLRRELSMRPESLEIRNYKSRERVWGELIDSMREVRKNPRGYILRAVFPSIVYEFRGDEIVELDRGEQIKQE